MYKYSVDFDMDECENALGIKKYMFVKGTRVYTSMNIARIKRPQTNYTFQCMAWCEAKII